MRESLKKKKKEVVIYFAEEGRDENLPFHYGICGAENL